MTQAFLAGTDITLAVPLLRDDEPFVADAGSINLELRGHTGAVLVNWALSGQTDTVALVPIGAINNALSGGRKTEKRTLIVSGTVDNKPFSIPVVYRLIGFLNLAVGPADVRSFVGVSPSELPDADIDMVAAYFDVGEKLTLTVLDAALAGDEVDERSANKAVVAQAVLNLIPSLQLRLTKSEADGALKTERFPVDLEKLRRVAALELDAAVTTLSGRTLTGYQPLIFTDRTDPFLGV
jgi:hypothetical protein